jgi:hypothetical protein
VTGNFYLAVFLVVNNILFCKLFIKEKKRKRKRKKRKRIKEGIKEKY